MYYLRRSGNIRPNQHPRTQRTPTTPPRTHKNQHLTKKNNIPRNKILHRDVISDGKGWHTMDWERDWVWDSKE